MHPPLESAGVASLLTYQHIKPPNPPHQGLCPQTPLMVPPPDPHHRPPPTVSVSAPGGHHVSHNVLLGGNMV